MNFLPSARTVLSPEFRRYAAGFFMNLGIAFWIEVIWSWEIVPMSSITRVCTAVAKSSSFLWLLHSRKTSSRLDGTPALFNRCSNCFARAWRSDQAWPAAGGARPVNGVDHGDMCGCCHGA